MVATLEIILRDKREKNNCRSIYLFIDYLQLFFLFDIFTN